MGLFEKGGLYPHDDHVERIQRYKENKKLFKGSHHEVFNQIGDRLGKDKKELIYVSVNLAGIICKKSADFLFGEEPVYSAGKEDDAPEQLAIERIVEENQLNSLNYKSALGNAYRGDSFYKIRWGQEYEGMVSKEFDPFRAIIEPQNAEYVFPETFDGDPTKIMAYHIAYPKLVETSKHGDIWHLIVESHYPNMIVNSKYLMRPEIVNRQNEIVQWKIEGLLEEPTETKTGVPFPLVVHVPNYSTDDSWEGIDDISEHKAIFDEINARLSQIADILDKHSDPPIAVPAGTIGEDHNGNPTYHVGIDKVFEVMGKDDVIPQYITWNGQLQSAFMELDKLVEMLLMTAEIPEVALGASNSGTSGSSGLAIKFRLNSLLAKINRKRQEYNTGLKKVFFIAELLEHTRSKDKPKYEITKPKIQFKDGLPTDELEQANIMQIRTGGKATISQKTALMKIDGLTDEQAEVELERIKQEQESEEFADVNTFNNEDVYSPTKDNQTDEVDV